MLGYLKFKKNVPLIHLFQNASSVVYIAVFFDTKIQAEKGALTCLVLALILLVLLLVNINNRTIKY